MLKRIELSGFKSFPKKTTLLFSVPISGVVGPNGSGKSNVAEAFRWVLGEQSMKSLRGKRGEDLIWNGSPGMPRSNHAVVSVAFDNSARKIPVDYDEVVISRHVYRDSTNEYYINNSQVRLKDVVELLSSLGIGASSHHIISQGEADRVLSASPVERREIIEEALGLTIFQYKREESEKKLEKTEENVKQVESLRRELRPHLAFLKKQVEKIEQGEKMREELLWLAREYFTAEDTILADMRRAISGKRDGPETERAMLMERIAELEARPKVETAEDSRYETDIREHERQLYNVRLEKDEQSRVLGRIEGRLEALPTQKQFRGNEVCGACGQVISQEAQERIQHQRDEAGRLETSKAELEAKLAVIRKEEARLVEVLSELRREAERAVHARRDGERELFEARAKRSQIESQLSAIQLEEERLHERVAFFERDLSDASRFVGQHVREYKQFEAAIGKGVEGDVLALQDERRRKMERIKVRLEDMGSEDTDVLREFKETTEREQFLEKEIADLTQSAEALRAIIAELDVRLKEEFTRGLSKINAQFGTFFTTMFGGGDASLELVKPTKKRASAEDLLSGVGDDEDAPLGIEVAVNLPRKKIKGLEMLSGGERALASIALLFAMSQVNPPPFLILDETDAALDEANSRRYGDMIETLAKASQLILITHNRETMSRAGVLYGVTMGTDGASRILSVQFEQAEQYAK